ncbi:hypothetical protein ACNOYE_10945 [Nannocystaceae bacterium ST9]
MPPDMTTYGTATTVMTLSTILTTGCSLGDQDDLSGADYGGPDGWGDSTTYYEEEESSSTSSSSSDSESDSSESSSSESDSSESDSGSTDSTGGPLCGWNESESAYACGFEGVDPGGTPIECPEGLVEGDPCVTTGLTAEGCCDADGNAWNCVVSGGGQVVAIEVCGGA